MRVIRLVNKAFHIHKREIRDQYNIPHCPVAPVAHANSVRKWIQQTEDTKVLTWLEPQMPGHPNSQVSKKWAKNLLQWMRQARDEDLAQWISGNKLSEEDMKKIC